jgi:hypothetical protein
VCFRQSCAAEARITGGEGNLYEAARAADDTACSESGTEGMVPRRSYSFWPVWGAGSIVLSRRADLKSRTDSWPSKPVGAWRCASAFVWCAEHVLQLEGENPFDNLMR